MARILLQVSFLILFPIHFSNGALEYINSDSPDYNDEVYKELAAEYEHELRKTDPPFIKSTTQKIIEGENAKYVANTVEESDEGTLARLSCEDPYFWNSFKCLWIDVKNWKWTERTIWNLKLVLITLSPFFILVFLLCGGSCYYWWKYRHYRRLRNEYAEKYKPGVIYLPNGDVDYFPPTREEKKALEKLLTVLATVS